jgi:hypothetical protein
MQLTNQKIGSSYTLRTKNIILDRPSRKDGLSLM